ncbi:MAG: APC family permease [bacterium]
METSKAAAPAADPVALNRTLGLLAITAFGVGDILGAGVYGLVGKIAGLVGNAAWLSYLAAGVTAALTGLTYAELSSRYPRAGGAAHFCDTAFRLPLLTFLVIIFVALSGLFSMATTSRVFANYAMAHFQDAPPYLRDYVLPIVFLLFIAFIAGRGIKTSSVANAVCTVIEVSALLVIIAVGLPFLGGVNYLEFAAVSNAAAVPPHVALVFSGATIAFFAFIGFEDMANLSEEVKDPERNVPRAICLAVLITGVIYGLIALVAVSVLPPATLAATKTPLLDVVGRAAPKFPRAIYSVVPAFAVFNTALFNLVMASRLFYGMSRGPKGLLPAPLAWLHPRWRTPVVSVGLGTAVALTLVLVTKDLAKLAAGTTTYLLTVFFLLHVGLIKLKFFAAEAPPRFRIPIAVPFLGLVACAVLLWKQEPAALIVAGWTALAAVVLFSINWFFFGRRSVEAVD